MLGVLTLTTAICGLTALDFYYRLRDYATKTAVAKIEEQITTQVHDQVDQMLKDAKPGLEDRLRLATEDLIARVGKETEEKIASAGTDATAGIAKARKDVEAEVAKAIKAVNVQIAELNKASQSANAAAQRARDLSMAGEQPETKPLPQAEACDPADLSAEQIELIGVKQRVSATDRKSDRGSPIYSNSFTVEAKPSEGIQDPAALERCLLAAVDRVVYKLSSTWFSPSSAVRSNPADRFRFGADVWGRTPIEAAIYLKGAQTPLTSVGSFAAQATPDRFLGPGG